MDTETIATDSVETALASIPEGITLTKTDVRTLTPIIRADFEAARHELNSRAMTQRELIRRAATAASERILAEAKSRFKKIRTRAKKLAEDADVVHDELLAAGFTHRYTRSGDGVFSYTLADSDYVIKSVEETISNEVATVDEALRNAKSELGIKERDIIRSLTLASITNEQVREFVDMLPRITESIPEMDEAVLTQRVIDAVVVG